MSVAWQRGRERLEGFRILRIGLEPERKTLYARINQRAGDMFRDGLVAETERLIATYGEGCRPLDSLGYKQAKAVLHRTLTLHEAVGSAQQGHRNYAKRQLTWFRREADVHWLHGFGSEEKIKEEAFRLVHGEMGGS
jgi:tRNA dimethylallyltransferase